MRKIPKMYKLLQQQSAFCPLPGEITNCLLITVTNERFFFHFLSSSGRAGRGRAGQGRAGQGRAGQGRGEKNDFCGLTVGNLSFCNPRSVTRRYSKVLKTSLVEFGTKIFFCHFFKNFKPFTLQKGQSSGIKSGGGGGFWGPGGVTEPLGFLQIDSPKCPPPSGGGGGGLLGPRGVDRTFGLLANCMPQVHATFVWEGLGLGGHFATSILLVLSNIKKTTINL